MTVCYFLYIDLNNFYLLTITIQDSVCAEIGLDEAGSALQATIGRFGVVVWAIGLLAAGQASTMSTTIAGQIVMDGFLHLRLARWKRTIITRVAALGPSILIAVATSDNADLRNGINEWLNILQSIQLPFAIIPVLTFTASAQHMGERFRNRGFSLAISCLLTLIVLGANIFLVTDFIRTHASEGHTGVIFTIIFGAMYAFFITMLLLDGRRIISSKTRPTLLSDIDMDPKARKRYGAVPMVEDEEKGGRTTSKTPGSVPRVPSSIKW